MPKLNWIGKEAVVKHHKEVPFRLLEPVPELSCGDSGSGNFIVQGDNLHAVKAVLPRYAGQVQLPGSAGKPAPILAVEYKGANRWAGSEDDRLIGGLWANLSGGRCRFVMVKEKRWEWIEEKLSPSLVRQR